jgi:sodium-coupled monocarboxylate transporter 8/12
LTIFGVVGGPLLGLFSLGMMTRRANQTGALTGLLTAMAFLFWIGFGKPKPPVKQLPLFANVNTCGFNVTSVEEVIQKFQRLRGFIVQAFDKRVHTAGTHVWVEFCM